MGSWEFVPTSSGWVAYLDAAERAAVLDVVEDVTELLAAEEPGGPWPQVQLSEDPVTAPADPALRRLLPDASRGAPEVAAEFRRLTEGELRTTKTGQLAVLRSALVAGTPEVRVARDDAPAVAAALTDLRLVLAERLGIRTEADADAAYRLVVEGGPLDVTDPDGVARRFLATVSTLLGVLQESLVGLMLDGLADAAGDDPAGDDAAGGDAAGDGAAGGDAADGRSAGRASSA